MSHPSHQPSAASAAGAASFERWQAELRSNAAFHAIYPEEADKSALGLELADAEAAGLSREELAHRLVLSPAEVERIEQGDSDAYPLSTLRRYVRELGDDFTLVVAARHRERGASSTRKAG